MYAFNMNATSRKDQGEFKANEVVPFIVYIDFKDLFGAEQLAKLMLLKEGFVDAIVLKRQFITAEKLASAPALKADLKINEAFEKGYSIQAFTSH